MEIERYLAASRKILAALTASCARSLRETGASVETPRGAFYLFPDFTPLAEPLAKRGVRTSDALCTRLLSETGVALLPGSAFGRPATELTARIATVDFDGARALSSLESRARDAAVDDVFLRAHCGAVLDAMTTLAGWLHGG
jgi:aspartate aminotransferase